MKNKNSGDYLERNLSPTTLYFLPWPGFWCQSICNSPVIGEELCNAFPEGFRYAIIFNVNGTPLITLQTSKPQKRNLHMGINVLDSSEQIASAYLFILHFIEECIENLILNWNTLFICWITLFKKQCESQKFVISFCNTTWNFFCCRKNIRWLISKTKRNT